jgi:hypothetical protein
MGFCDIFPGNGALIELNQQTRHISKISMGLNYINFRSTAAREQFGF